MMPSVGTAGIEFVHHWDLIVATAPGLVGFQRLRSRGPDESRSRTCIKAGDVFTTVASVLWIRDVVPAKVRAFAVLCESSGSGVDDCGETHAVIEESWGRCISARSVHQDWYSGGNDCLRATCANPQVYFRLS